MCSTYFTLFPVKKILHNHPLVVLLGVLLVVVLLLGIYALSNSTTLQVVFLDVGQGDALLITTPHGRQVLVDAGPSNTLGQTIAPYMSVSDRSLDLVMLTHPDLDHVGGMVSLVDRYDIGMVMHSGLLAGSPVYAAIAERIRQKNIPTMSAEAGQVITLEPGVILEIYSPYPSFESLEPNDYSIVARLVYGTTSVMLTGDATKQIELEVTETFGDRLQSDILKVGHHGSQTSTSDPFVEAVSPQYAVLSYGCNNRFGHPHGEVLATLFSHQIELYDTCNDGDVVFESDGEEWFIKK